MNSTYALDKSNFQVINGSHGCHKNVSYASDTELTFPARVVVVDTVTLTLCVSNLCDRQGIPYHIHLMGQRSSHELGRAAFKSGNDSYRFVCWQ